MINKKFVALVLAVGLVLSIGFVLGQYNIAKKDIGRLLNQQQGTLGIVANYTLVEQDTRMSANEPEIGYFTPPIEYSGGEGYSGEEGYSGGWSPAISRYNIAHLLPTIDGQGGLVAVIECSFSDETEGGTIYFMRDQAYDETDPHLVEVTPGYFQITVPYSRYDEIVDTFRTGRNIRVYIGDPTRPDARLSSEGIVPISS